MITLEEFRTAIEEHERKAGRKAAAELWRKYRVLERLKNRKRKTRKDISAAMKGALCFSNIAYCCGSPSNPFGEGKQCHFRDGFLDALGLTHKDFEAFKRKCDGLFWQFLDLRREI